MHDKHFAVDSYSWAGNEAGTQELDTNWSHATESANPANRSAYVILHYHDGSQQAVEVPIHINSDSESQHINTDPSDPTGKHITGDPILAHVVDDGADEHVDAASAVKVTVNGTQKSLSDIGASIAWGSGFANSLEDVNDGTNNWQDATITFADGSTKAVQIRVKVVGVTRNNTVTTTRHGEVPDVNDSVTKPTVPEHNAWNISDVQWADEHGNALSGNSLSDFFAQNTDSSNVTINGTTYDHAKAGYILVTYKRGNTADGSQLIEVPVKINSDRDSINPTNTDNFNSQHGIYKTHVGAEINGQANFHNVDLKDQIGFRDADDHPLFVDPQGNPTWSFEGFTTDPSTGAITNVNLDPVSLTNGENDITDLYAKVKLPDESITYVKMNHVYVYGGYAHADNSDGTRFTKINNGSSLTEDQAKAAIANNTVLTNATTVGASNKAISFTWAKDENGTSLNQTDMSWHTGDSVSNLDRLAYVIIGYADGTKQAVEVHYDITKDSDSQHINTDPSDPTGKHITGDPILAHVADNGGDEHVDPISAVKINNEAITSGSNIHVAWDHLDAIHTLLQSENNGDSDWQDATITFADGSTKAVQIRVKVVGAKGKVAATVTNHGAVPNASDAVIAPDATNAAWNIGSVQWADEHGNALSGNSLSDFFAHNTDGSDITINGQTYHNAKKAYALVSYKRNGQADGSQLIEVPVQINSEADNYNPVGGEITKHLNETLNETDAENAISNRAAMPEHTGYAWQNAPTLDSFGIKSGVVKLNFNDGSSKEVSVLVNVLSYANDPNFAPIGGSVTVDQNHVVDAADAENAVVNHESLRSIVDSHDGYSWSGTVDTSVTGSHVPGIVKVKYNDGSVRNVGVTVIVNGTHTTDNTTDASRYNPAGKIIEAHFHEDLTGHAVDGISNTDAMPSGTSYEFADGVPATDHSGYEPTIIKVKFADNSTKLVLTQVHVTSDADRYNPTSRPVTVDPHDPSQPVDPTDSHNPTPGVDPSTVPSGTTTGWPTDPSGHPIVPDQTTPGDHPATIIVHYPDGSETPIPTINHVPGTHTPQPGHVENDADRNDPIGTVIEKNMGEQLNDTDAQHAISNANALHNVSGYTWDFAPDTATHGLKAGRVKVSYSDHSADIVDVLVNVKSMADRFNPTPSPVVVDPNNPSQPTDPSDPHNPTPGVDPSTVPTGTHTGWPTDPSGHPVIPDHTPGTHPGQIVIHYPDGSHTVLPVPVVNPSDRDRYTPTPRPIQVTPGENPSDITRPTNTDPIPGVDPTTVPTGSHTILDPSDPTPDTTTPGTRPVHVIVIYPDGSQSDPIPTNIVVPDTGNHNVPEPTPEPEPVEPTVNVETTPTEPAPQTPATVTTRISFSDGQREIAGLPITGKEGETIPLAKIQAIVKDNMPKGYVLDMDLEQAWKDGKFVITAKHPITIKIAKVRRQLVLFVDKRGRIVGRAYIQVKVKDQLTKELFRDLTGKHMPKGYKMTGYKKVAKHIDIFVSGKKTKATSHGKLVLYVRKDGKIVKKLNISLVKGKFSKHNAKMHLPKGYKMTGHTHINRHNDVWVVKK